MNSDLTQRTLAAEWIHKAGVALVDFFRPDVGCFLRATGPSPVRHDAMGPFPAETGATSSNRAYLATLELLFFLLEEQLVDLSRPSLDDEYELDASRWQRLGHALADACATMASQYYRYPVETLQQHSENGRNDFTDAHLLLALSTFASRFAGGYLQLRAADDLHDRIGALADALEQKLDARGGATLSTDGPTHPLMTLHALRAVEVARHVVDRDDGRSRVPDTVEARLRRGAREDVLRQIGLYTTQDAEFDPAALLGALAILHRFAGMSSRKLVLKGMELMAASQAHDGSWSTQILTGDRQLVYIPSLELAVLVSNVVLADLSDGSDDLAAIAAPMLERSIDYLEAAYRELDSVGGAPSAGWTNDQARQPDVVESWATALALQLLLRVRRIRRRAQQLTILKQYRVSPRERPRKEWLRWPDLAGPVALVRSADREMTRARRALAKISDPSKTAAISERVWTDVVEATLRDPFDRPPKASSFILYGPPGTRKSSMVATVAEALDWPLVTLSPPDFLRNGMAALESRAEDIFRDLLRLRRVVVFFDECEELFRRRTVANAPEHRVQSDFITSGMLPRLQELRYSRWVVFAIATNTELDELDPAVVRFGRIDGQQRIGHPSVEAQLRYLGAKGLPDEVAAVLPDVLHSYDHFLDADREPVCRTELRQSRRRAREAFETDGDLVRYFDSVNKLRVQEAELPEVTFVVLDQLAAYLHEAPSVSAASIAKALRDLCSTKGRPAQWTESAPEER